MYFPSSSSLEQNIEHARLRDKMGDTQHHHHHLHHQTRSSRLALRNSGGEIVEVQGGHIVRSTGRKDRHSKVCTAKGPRDRRVRLSANTAIQFYDVQDRLGYDRPSKAVDWLIKKAKAAIDELAELPAWKPTTGSLASAYFEAEQPQKPQDENQPQLRIHHCEVADDVAGSSSGGRATVTAMLGTDDAAARCDIQSQHHQQLQMGNNQRENGSSFLPPSLHSDAIADTIKSFFPMGASAETNSSQMPFQSFPPPDLTSRTSSQSQDLRLSLQSFQNPILLQHHQSHPNSAHQTHPALFSGATQMEFDASGWSEQHQSAELGRFQRMVTWNSSGDTGGAGGGFVFNSPPLLQPFFGQNQLFSQRGPLQSSNTPSVRAWIEPTSISNATTADHHHHSHQALPIYPSSISGIGFSGGAFSGFCIPARIQGEEEEHDRISDKRSSASSDSRH